MGTANSSHHRYSIPADSRLPWVQPIVVTIDTAYWLRAGYHSHHRSGIPADSRLPWVQPVVVTIDMAYRLSAGYHGYRQ